MCFSSLELKKILQVHVLSFYTILKKTYQSSMNTFIDKKTGGEGLRKKNKPRNKKKKQKKQHHTHFWKRKTLII